MTCIDCLLYRKMLVTNSAVTITVLSCCILNWHLRVHGACLVFELLKGCQTVCLIYKSTIIRFRKLLIRCYVVDTSLLHEVASVDGYSILRGRNGREWVRYGLRSSCGMWQNAGIRKLMVSLASLQFRHGVTSQQRRCIRYIVWRGTATRGPADFFSLEINIMQTNLVRRKCQHVHAAELINIRKYTACSCLGTARMDLCVGPLNSGLAEGQGAQHSIV